LRAEIRALAIKRRSIEAIRRPNRLVEGTKPREAVLDIGFPFRGGVRLVMIWEQSTYTRYQQQYVCLHSSMSSFAVQQIAAECPPDSKKGRRNDRRPFELIWSGLFGGLLARRIERAGIVDLRHLVIAEAKDLAQDFVGMFAEQG
jgi:hypothetical protein